MMTKTTKLIAATTLIGALAISSGCAHTQCATQNWRDGMTRDQAIDTCRANPYDYRGAQEDLRPSWVLD